MLNITNDDGNTNFKVIQYFENIVLAKMETSTYPKYGKYKLKDYIVF